MVNPKGAVFLSINDVCTILSNRQENEFDANFGVSGRRGNGKSTLMLKILLRFSKAGFRQEKHQVYERSHVMALLSEQKKSFCWDDEAINSAYKRDFQNKQQHELIKLVTNYRDNFNIYGSALPFFFSLDRDLRELIFMHIHVIQRGLAVVFMQKQDQIHSLDPWDSKYNQKIEETESKRTANNPLAKFRYERFSTFVGYLHFSDATPKQKKIYLEIKHRKRAKRFDKEGGMEENKEVKFVEYLFDLATTGQLTKQSLLQFCTFKGKKPSIVQTNLNTMLRDKKIGKTLSQLYKEVIDKEPVIKEKPVAVAQSIPNF